MDDVQRIDIDYLVITWETLQDVARNYELGSPGEASLIEARRLIEVELRTQYGDDAWEALSRD